MKHLLKWSLVLTATLGMVLSSCAKEKEQKETLSVAASVYPVYDFAGKIAGDKAQVTLLVPAGMDSHDWEPKTSDMITLEKADLFIYNGAGMEHWTETVLKALSNPKLVAVDTSKGIDLLGRIDSREEDEEQRHEQYDPHIWLSPVNAKKQLHAIYEAFAAADPENKDYYQANYERYAKEADLLHEEYKAATESAENRNIVTSHQAFAYLCREYGLVQTPIQGIFADAEPSQARMREVIELIRDKQVKVIFAGAQVSSKTVDTIAAETGAAVEVLNPIESLTPEQQKNGEDYFSVMRKNLEALKKALRK